ncbi:hypothetical protein [Chamaesiphon sp. VAR_48_metabat_135_sub]|uniref:hypothetical protein n=1 Tax=Chamaesiphon sp. VAR_48_metabat_135_sub TaxID=2964699 RepID=UPI00286A7B9E|nr:hypothetical protein [Chamaesiphon sp. VAR_48_metabat_135_sub]
MNTKELIVSELESTSEELLSEVLKFVKSIKRQHPRSIPHSGGYANATTTRQRTPNLEQGKIVMSDDFNEPLPNAFWLGVED